MTDIELLTDVYAFLCFNPEPTKDEIANMKKTIKQHIQKQMPPHVHEAGISGNIDECNLCGHDIRNKIHINR